MNQPIVSVGIPTYNRPSGLLRTLDCITGQTYKNLEIIISDNCSPDYVSDEIVHSFQKNNNRIHYFRQNKNRGMDFNFRYVLSKASGKFFMWAADDDEWEPEFIEACIEKIQNTGSVMTAFDTVFRKNGQIEHNPMPNLSINNTPYQNAALFLECLQPSLFYGIHHRQEILCVLNEEFFDFYDCFFVLRQIINNNFVLINDKVLYKVGIDTEQYIKKPFNPIQGRVFEYKPFLVSCLNLVLESDRLNIKEKLLLCQLISEVVSNLFMYHEQENLTV
jgi:glycosyltransferase involved in cell wall biosynthesis